MAVTGPRDGKLVAPRLAVCAGCEYVTKPAERLWKCTHPRCNCHTSLQEKTHYVRAACPAGKWEK